MTHPASRSVLALDQTQTVRVDAKGQARYWTVEQGRVLVGELPELVAAMRRPSLSASALFAMAAGRASIWLSPFEGVHRLTFGHELRVGAGEPRVTRWLRPEDSEAAQGDPVELMREAIIDAIDEAVGTRTSATVALSGGLDSTVVLALASRNPQLRDGLQAYCATPAPGSVAAPKGRFADEWEAASSVARHVGVPVRRLAHEDAFCWLDAADDVHARTLLPVQVPGNLWWLRRLEHEASSRTDRIILTGQSGNATFSNGLPKAPRPLRVDGTHELPSRLRDALRWKSWRPRPPSVLRAGLHVQMPSHVLDMRPWTRWCLAEPPTPARGPWSGADVVWHDPLGSARVVMLAMSLPSSVWGLDRDLARAVGRGLIPEQVRLCRDRGIQGTDLTAMIARHADAYIKAIDRVCGSASAREFLDPAVLRGSADLLRGDLRSAAVFREHYLHPLAVGLFAAWWDDHGPPDPLRSGQRPSALP